MDSQVVTEWIIAGTSTFAVIAAVWATRRAGALLKIEHNRDAMTELRRRREQAESVTAWFDRRSTEPVGQIFQRTFTTYGAQLRNASSLPVYEVRLTWHLKSDPTQERACMTLGLAPPGLEEFLPNPQELRIRGADDKNGMPIYTESVDGFVVSLKFRDAAGTTWFRNAHGLLSEVRSGEDPQT